MSEKKNVLASGIGGQAVLEGIMMKNKDNYAVAVRKPDKTIEVDVKTYKSFNSDKKLLQMPFIRGVFNFVDSLVVGIKSLTFSSSFYDDEEVEEETKFEKWLTEKLGSKLESVVMATVVAFSIAFSILLFMVLPLFIADLLERFVPFVTQKHIPIIEGVVKLAIFILYTALISLMKDIKRTYMYHGAEHKCINCIESGKTLTVENVRKSSRFHKRCGTSFLLIVMIISIIIFFAIDIENRILRYVVRILLVPVIAGISYEFIRLAGKSDNPIVGLLSKPGMWMQKITTKEPDDGMIEVAIVAVEAVFDWKKYLADNGIEIAEGE